MMNAARGARSVAWACLCALILLGSFASPGATQQPQIYFGKPTKTGVQKRKRTNWLARCLANPVDRTSCQAAIAARGRTGFETGGIGISAYVKCQKEGGVCLEVGTLIFDRASGKGARVHQDKKKRIVSIDIEILFDHAADTIKTVEAPKLRALAAALNDPLNKTTRFAVIGHTDTSGDAEYNCSLSHRRANAVRRSLVDLGVAEGRLQTIAAGEFLPRYPANGAAPENRRVAFGRTTRDNAELARRMARLCIRPH